MKTRMIPLAALVVAALVCASATPRAAVLPVRQDCWCDGDSLMAPIATFLPCVDASTLESGVMNFDAKCNVDCLPDEKCRFLVYAYADAPSGCNSGCDVEFRMPGYVSNWTAEIWQTIDLECGTEKHVAIVSRCSSACTGACAATNTMIYSAMELTCATCAPR